MTGRHLLKQVPLFSSLTEEEIAQMFDVARERGYPKNSVILFEDDPGDALYVVASGRVKVVLIGEAGKEVILSVLKDGTPGLTLMDENGKNRVGLLASRDGPTLTLYDEKQSRAVLGVSSQETIRTGTVTKRPESSLVLYSKEGKVLWQAPQD